MLEAGFYLGGVGDIHRHGERRAAGGFDFGYERRKFFGGAGGYGDFCAGFGQEQGRGAPYSLRRSGD